MPNTLTLIRHGQSIGNVDEKLYSTTPDNAMPLTKLGWEQANQAGKCLKERILHQGADGGVHFIVSPYVRTVETFHGIVSAWCDPSEFNHITDRDQRLKAWYSRLLELGLTWHEDPRIREQGTYDVVRKRMTQATGSYRKGRVWW
jgi:broad specificity phosphatase PhoE